MFTVFIFLLHWFSQQPNMEARKMEQAHYMRERERERDYLGRESI